MKTRKRIMATIVAMVMTGTSILLTVAPLTVSAEPAPAWTKSAANTTLGTVGIEAPTIVDGASKWNGNYVYYGKYDGIAPTKYRVLAPVTTTFNGESILLDCDSVLYLQEFKWTGGGGITWSGCDIQSGLNGDRFLNKSGNFTSIEKNAIIYSKTSINSNYTNLNNEQVFLLDFTETKKAEYGYSSQQTKIKESAAWWSRTPDTGMPGYARSITENGQNGSTPVNYKCGVSPAFNVDLNSVMFSSVVSGDSTATSGKVYKLTLKDPAFGIGITTGKSVTANGTTISVPYTVTDTDANLSPDTVSVLIKDMNDTILYYSPLSSIDAESGTSTFTLPATLGLDNWGTGYTVSILAENVNGQNETDYTSVPVELSKPVSAPTESKLADGKYTQTATKINGENTTYYTRFVFVVPKTEFTGKSKIVFSVDFEGRIGDKPTVEKTEYYTGVTSNGVTFTSASDDSAMLIVTVSSGRELNGLTCEYAYK